MKPEDKYEENEIVRVTITKNGYFKGVVNGRFIGLTPTGKIRVLMLDGYVKIFSPRNVSHKN